MANSFFYQPVKIAFGENELQKLRNICADLNFSSGILIIDKIFANSIAPKIVSNCSAIKAIFSDITPNPRLSDVCKAAELMKEINADFAVAVGGGSSIDLAKFACSMKNAEYPIREYFYKRQTFDKAGIPLIAVPTTAGTGSEVTSVSVCNDEQNNVKAPLLHSNFYPYMAIVDPLLTLSVPPYVTAQTGLDALSHAIEGFWSKNNNIICDMFAQEAAKLIFANFEKAYLNGQDTLARRNMSLASLYAGIAFSIPKTAGVHACSYPLSENYGLTHGEACAFTLDSFIRLNSKDDNCRITGFARQAGFENADKMADEVLRLKQITGLPTTLEDCNINDIRKLAEDCHKHPLMNNNPRKLSVEELIEMFGKLSND